MEELPDELIVDARLQGLTERTLGTYTSQLKYYLEWIDGDPREVEKDDFKRFLAHLQQERTASDGAVGLAPRTVNGSLSEITTFYKFINDEGHVQENLAPSFRNRHLDGGDSGGDSAH